MTSINSEEANYLIYRYLQEAGFEHSSFVFGQESFIAKPPAADSRHSLVPPGMLISLLQKGLQYLSIEHHLNEDGTEKCCTKPFHILEPHVCDEPMQVDRGEEKTNEPMLRPQLPGRPIIPPDKLIDPYEEMKQLNNNNTVGNVTNPNSPVSSNGLKNKRKKNAEEPFLNVFENEFQISGHEAEATGCAFNPQDFNIFASCSSDGTLKIWNTSQELLHTLSHTATTKNLQDGYEEEKPLDVTCLQWSSDGKHILTSSFWGTARIWNTIDGNLESVLSHGGNSPVLAAKFKPNSNGKVVATLHNNEAIIWENEKELYRFSDHTKVAMDLDWTEDSLATCSMDKTVQVYFFENGSMFKHTILNHHTNEVNSVRWCPHNPKILASCSDDSSVILWKPQDNNNEFHRFTNHTGEIYTMEWSPKDSLLATASFDKTARIFDLNTLQCKNVLDGAKNHVMSLAWSPDGKYLATGSADNFLRVYSVNDGELIHLSKSSGAIFSININSNNSIIYTNITGQIFYADIRK